MRARSAGIFPIAGIFPVASIFLIAGLTACASRGVLQREYVLAATAVGPVASADTASPTLALGVGPIELPRYLRRPQIVTREGVRLSPSDLHVWGGDLQADTGRVLAENLSTLLPTDQVWTFPWSDPRSLDYRVSLQVSRFERDAEGTVELVAHWVLFEKGNQLLRTHRSAIRHRTEARPRDYEATVRAMSEALSALSAEISVAILEHAADPVARRR